jgi:cyanate permease
MAQTGGALSPAIFGAILDMTSSYDVGWILLGSGALLLSSGPIFLIRERY